MRPAIFLVLAPIFMGACSEGEVAATGDPPIPPGFELRTSLGFDDEGTERAFHFTDSLAWSWSPEGTLDLKGESKYEPMHRSPRSIALLEGAVFRDFVLEADLMQTGREYGHRDLCLFFAYQDPTRFYYVHLATSPDENAHNVFLVDQAARRPLAPVAEQGVAWDGGWHRVRLERVEGRIRVFFDDLWTPILEVTDTTLDAGQVGFGSFDDEGRFDNVRIWSP